MSRNGDPGRSDDDASRTLKEEFQRNLAAASEPGAQRAFRHELDRHVVRCPTTRRGAGQWLQIALTGPSRAVGS